MQKLKKFSYLFLFSLIWLLIASFLERYWNIFHWKYIFLPGRLIFDLEFWYFTKKLLFGFDLGFYLEELFKFITYVMPKELFKFLPIYIYIKSYWIRKD